MRSPGRPSWVFWALLADYVAMTLAAAEYPVVEELRQRLGLFGDVPGDHGVAGRGIRQQDMLLAEPGTRPFDMTSRPMKGWIVVDASMCSEEDNLRRWVSRGVAHSRSLPPK